MIKRRIPEWICGVFCVSLSVTVEYNKCRDIFTATTAVSPQKYRTVPFYIAEAAEIFCCLRSLLFSIHKIVNMNIDACNGIAGHALNLFLDIKLDSLSD